MMRMLSVVLLFTTGCAILNPGGQAATALKQSTTYGWDQDEFRAVIVGSQEAQFTMIEGTIVFNDDGTPDLAASSITAYLHSDPSAQAGVDASTVFAQMGMQQTEAITGMVKDLVAAFKPVAPVPP